MHVGMWPTHNFLYLPLHASFQTPPYTSPLQVATGQKEVVKSLLERGANINYQDIVRSTCNMQNNLWAAGECNITKIVHIKWYGTFHMARD